MVLKDRPPSPFEIERARHQQREAEAAHREPFEATVARLAKLLPHEYDT
jgi:hypothetical protein